MNPWLKTLIFAIEEMMLSSCSEVESDEIRHHHDTSVDEFRMRFQYIAILGGQGSRGVHILTEKCFSGHLGNSLNYIRGNHPQLLQDEVKITSGAKGFLTGGN